MDMTFDLEYFIHPIPWVPVAYSVLQAIACYFLVLLGLKLIGRRVFSDKNPKNLIILLLISRCCEMTHDESGFWGTIFSVATLLILGSMGERLRLVRHFLHEEPIPIYCNGKLDRVAMRQNLVRESDLNEAARSYGRTSYADFEIMVLEQDGEISGVPLKRGVTAEEASRSPTILHSDVKTVL